MIYIIHQYTFLKKCYLRLKLVQTDTILYLIFIK